MASGKHTTIGIILACLLLLLMPLGIQAALAGTIEVQLANLAQASLMAQNEILVHGDTKTDLTMEFSSMSHAATFRNFIENALERRAFLAKHNLFYTDFRTELIVNRTDIQQNKATLSATEHTILKVSLSTVDSLAPKNTMYIQNHIFTFVFENNKWKLSGDKLVNVPEPIVPEAGMTPLDKSIIPSNPITPDGYKPTVNSDITPSVAGLLQRQQIINYAYQYGINGNPDYRDFSSSGGGGDCTNFVSQSLYSGGWTMVSGFYQYDTAWWYNIATQSYPWVNAHKWNIFTRNRPRATFATYVSDLIPGDILQADWDRDGIIDHTMIVTKKDGSGTIYLTYHTNNTVDRSFWDIYNSSPGTNWYALHLMDIYDVDPNLLRNTFLPIIFNSDIPSSPYPAPSE